ncbi:hypothetical protein [Arthrobacter sp. S41]|nr:hypothetical protein [Arthrobacter sp. S41]
MCSNSSDIAVKTQEDTGPQAFGAGAANSKKDTAGPIFIGPAVS